MNRTPMKSFEIIKEMYEYFVKKSRDLEPKLMICEKEDFDNVENALKRLENYEQNEDFNKDVLNYAFLNEQDKIKKLKALEILRRIIACEDDKAFPEYQENDIVTKEEYDLLKEVLL